MEQHLVFRFTHDSVEYNIATASFVFEEDSALKVANGVIPSDKALSLTKEMGLFLWGSKSEYQFSDLWIINKSQSVNNIHGKYDDFINIIRDTAVELFVAEVDAQGNSVFVDWEKVGEYHIDRVKNSGDNFIVISLLSKLVYMEKNTANTYYSDTLDYASNREQSRPIAIGTCFNVPVVLVDDVDNIYELNNDVTVINIVAAYDDYDPFVETTDFVQEVIVSTSGYGINLVNPPVGKITVDFDGGDYKGLLTEHSGISIDDIDLDSLDDIDLEWGGDYGIFIEQPTNIRSLVEDLNVAHCGYCYINQSGQIAFGWLKEPSLTPDYTFSQHYIASPGIDIEPDGAPGLSDGVASVRNWHLFTYGEVKDVGISQAEKDKVTKQFQSYYRASGTVAETAVFNGFYEAARNGDFIETLGADPAMSEALTNYLEALFAVQRKKYTFEIIVTDLFQAMKMNIGETINITWPRYGLESGKNMIMTKIEYNNILNRIIKVTGWA